MAVAQLVGTFSDLTIEKAVYEIGWDGTVVVEMTANGRIVDDLRVVLDASGDLTGRTSVAGASW